MKLGFFSPQISRSMGGISNTTYLFTESFPNICDFKCFCASNSEEVPKYESSIIRSRYKQYETIPLHLDLIRKSLKENKIHRFDFTFSVLYSYSLPCLILKKIFGIPYGIMIHGSELMPEPKRDNFFGNILLFIKNKLKSVLLKNADIVFANSEYTKKMCQSQFKCKNISVIHPPIKYEDKNVDYNDNSRSYIILSIGRLMERKGFQYVVKAFPKIKEKYPNVKYYIAGDGPYKTQLNELIKKTGIDDSIKMLGRVSEKEKEELYQKCDFFIMPSYMIKNQAEVEGFGIVFIEANMYGKYVIGSDSGGIPEAIIDEETGSIVKPCDSQEIEKTIIGLYSNKITYSRRSCVEWSKKMDNSEISRQYLECIKMVLKGEI